MLAVAGGGSAGVAAPSPPAQRRTDPAGRVERHARAAWRPRLSSIRWCGLDLLRDEPGAVAANPRFRDRGRRPPDRGRRRARPVRMGARGRPAAPSAGVRGRSRRDRARDAGPRDLAARGGDRSPDRAQGVSRACRSSVAARSRRSSWPSSSTRPATHRFAALAGAGCGSPRVPPAASGMASCCSAASPAGRSTTSGGCGSRTADVRRPLRGLFRSTRCVAARRARAGRGALTIDLEPPAGIAYDPLDAGLPRCLSRCIGRDPRSRSRASSTLTSTASPGARSRRCRACAGVRESRRASSASDASRPPTSRTARRSTTLVALSTWPIELRGADHRTAAALPARRAADRGPARRTARAGRGEPLRRRTPSSRPATRRRRRCA